MRRLIVAICVIFLLAPAAAVRAAEPEAAGPDAIDLTDTIELTDADLVSVIRLLAESAGENVMIDPGVTGKVTVSLRGVSAREAFDVVLKMYGCSAVKDGNILRVVYAPESSKPQLERRVFVVGSALPTDESAQASLIEQITTLVSNEGEVILNAPARTVVVEARPERLEEVAEFLKLLDVRRKQVMIEARLLEVALDDRDQLGFEFSWIFTQDTAAGGTVGTLAQALLPPAATEFEVGIVSNHLDATVQALATRAYVNLLSSPKIAVLDGETAYMEVIEKLPYVQSTVAISTDGGGSTTTSEEVVFEEVGVKLTVLPTIGRDRFVELTVSPEVSIAPERFNGVPVVDRRSAKTMVSIADGQVLAIGGLIREDRLETVKRVPLLSAIPVIGHLFRSNDFKTVKTELLILIQPTILDEDVPRKLTDALKERVEERRETFRDKPKAKLFGG